MVLYKMSFFSRKGYIEFVVLTVTALLIIFLIVLGIGMRSGSGSSRRHSGDGPVITPDEAAPLQTKRPSRNRTSRPAPETQTSRGFHQCPLCGSILERHERVKSVLYPGKPDGIMEIYGCPYCYGPNASRPRKCPVCSQPIPAGGIVYARFFETPQRRHVHVLGCAGCYTRRTPR
ncbi:MAG: hypothetical protein SVR04_14435 [Spirochaetota bacterium]|nr:hypothetical protein [Spirochaetota bacterium]